MKRRLPGILLAAAIGTIGVYKFVTIRPVVTNGTSEGDELPVRAAERLAPVRAGDDNPVDEASASPSSALPEHTGAVLSQPKTVRLGAVETVPSGPEVGDQGSGLTPTTVLENMRSTFRQYQSRFRENPVGDNAEITRALNGANPGKTTFVQAEDGLRLNARGELIDNWGTPFFFHQLSRTQMEIRSAGPDRRMWSADDLVLK